MKKKLFLLTIALLCAVVQGAWAQTEVGTEEALREAIGSTGSNKSVKMTADIPLSSRLVIENGKNVTLDLDGKKLSRSLSSATDDGNVIRVETGGILTVKDGSGNNSGQITGGKAINGGGICNHGTLTLEGGTIARCSASSNGGGIYNAPATAGGAATTVIVKGGIITGNTCGDQGAGIYNYPGCTLNMEGCVKVSENHKGSSNSNVYLDGQSVISVTGALTDSHVGVNTGRSLATVITSGYKAHNPSAAADDCFFSDITDLNLMVKDNEVQLTREIVKYIERRWNGHDNVVIESELTCYSFTVLEGNHPDDWMQLGSAEGEDHHYYVAVGNVSYKTLNCFGKVHLILADGATLTCTGGIKVENDNNAATLYIHEQRNHSGRLVVTNSYNAAGIGSSEGQDCGIINIQGGNLDIKGGDGAAGIGGGASTSNKNANGNYVFIYGGTVVARGGDNGAGIGTGSADVFFLHDGTPSGILFYQYGGTVTATGGGKSAGVGGGNHSNGPRYAEVYGGTLNAQGGSEAPGIGSGQAFMADYYIGGGELHVGGGTVNATGGKDAPGIGGGSNAYNANVVVSGGMVRAQGTGNAAGIGCSHYNLNGRSVDSTFKMSGGTVVAIAGGDNAREEDGVSAIGSRSGKDTIHELITLPTTHMVTAGDSETNPERVFTSTERIGACIWRNYVRIEPCDHKPHNGDNPADVNFRTYINHETHSVGCIYCEDTQTEAHTGYGCICGYGKTAIKFYEPTGYSRYSEAKAIDLIYDNAFTLPACQTVPDGCTFAGWEMNPDAATLESWHANKTAETEGWMYAAGTQIKSQLDPVEIKFYARYLVDITAKEWKWDSDNLMAAVTLTSPALPSDVTAKDDVRVTKTDIDGGWHLKATFTFDYNGYDYTFSDEKDMVELKNDADNTATLTKYTGRKVDVEPTDRTIFCDGKWNTLCLPFDMDGFSGTPLEGATVKTLESSNYDSTTKTLTLNFSNATSLEAGKPYLVKLASDEHLVNPIFQDVTVSATQAGTVSTTYVDFRGSFSPVALTGGDKTVLYLGADNKLYYPSAEMTIGSCRAVFRLKGITAGDLPSGTRSFVLNFGDGETATGIIGIGSTRTDTDKNDGYWYDLQGRKLSGKPTQKGIYINHGNKVVIK